MPGTGQVVVSLLANRWLGAWRIKKKSSEGDSAETQVGPRQHGLVRLPTAKPESQLGSPPLQGKRRKQKGQVESEAQREAEVSMCATEAVRRTTWGWEPGLWAAQAAQGRAAIGQGSKQQSPGGAGLRRGSRAISRAG